MIFLYRKIILIFLSILYFTRLEDIPEWNREPLYSSLNIPNVDSYAFDSENNDELFLFNNRSQLNLKYGGNEINLTNNKDIQKIESPLIKFNSYYYFCASLSSTYTLMKINITNEDIISIDNPQEVKGLNFTLKCLRGEESILLAFLGTPYLNFFFPLIDKNETYAMRNKNSILDINFCGMDSANFLYVVLDKNKSDFHFIHIFKKAFEDLQEQYIHDIPNIKLYKNIEILARRDGNIIGYIFSYDKDLKQYSFYIVDTALQDEGTSKDAKEYFSFFKEFKIKYAKLMEHSSLLYYSIESLKNDRTSYIGLVDIRYIIIIFNIKEKVDSHLYCNKRNLFYFYHNKKISFCPFGQVNDICSEYSEYIDINEKGGIYENSLIKECNSDKIKLGFYCVNNCPNGFADKGNECEICQIIGGKLIYYRQHSCIDEKECKEKHYNSSNGICYDCSFNNTNSFFFRNECISSCEEVYGVEGGNEKCIVCKDIQTFYSFKLHDCIPETKCINGVLNKDLYYCRECETLKKVYNKYNDTCLDNCNFFEQLKNISNSDSDTNNIISNNNITSTSNIVEDININLTYSFVYIFNDILKILEKSDFIVNIKEDKIKIMYGDNQSKDF